MKRRRPIPQQQKSRLLATATPSMQYRWYKHNFRDVTLEARLVNNKVIFYEVNGTSQRCISERIVHALFPIGTLVKNQPFRKEENRDFYAVLNRHRKRYQEKFNQLKQQ
jgi:hypothetical protein